MGDKYNTERKNRESIVPISNSGGDRKQEDNLDLKKKIVLDLKKKIRYRQHNKFQEEYY